MQNLFTILSHIIKSPFFNDVRLLHQPAEETLFSKGKVQKFDWTKNYSHLSATIKNEKKQTVVSLWINKKNMNVEHSCDCKQGFICIHIIAVFMTIRFFLSNEYQQYTPYTIETGIAIQTQLLYGNCTDNSAVFASLSSKISICLFPIAPITSIMDSEVACFVIKNGSLVPSHKIDIPEDLKPFSAMAYSPNNGNLFITFIESIASKYPIYVCNENECIPVQWNKKLIIEPITQIHCLDNSYVRINRAGKYNDEILTDLVLIETPLILDTKTKNLGILTNNNDSWHCANAWQKSAKRTTPQKLYNTFPSLSQYFEITTNSFNESTTIYYPLDANHIKNFIFTSNGNTILPEQCTPNSKITIHQLPRNNGKTTILEGEVYRHDYQFDAPNLSHIKRLITLSSNMLRKCKHTKSKEIWTKGFFAAGCAKNKEELKKIIDEVANALATHYSPILKRTIINRPYA